LCENIASKEALEIAEAAKIEDSREAGAEIQWAKSTADELRREARSVAVVTLVTRFQHWLRVFVEEMKKKPANGVDKNLETLNKGLGGGEGPVPAAFFCDLETVRDSIIHADSNVEWMRGEVQRRVPLKYREVNLEHLSNLKLTEEQLREIRENAMARINLTDAHIQEAMEKSIQQIKCHGSHDHFIEDLSKVWSIIGRRAQDDAHLYVRFGSIPSAKSDARRILKASLEEAGSWRLIWVRNAQTSDFGKRQADYMGGESDPATEFDFHAQLN
jgi:hypothetical protein